MKQKAEGGRVRAAEHSYLIGKVKVARLVLAFYIPDRFVYSLHPLVFLQTNFERDLQNKIALQREVLIVDKSECDDLYSERGVQEICWCFV